MSSASSLPTGTVSFLFTDIEGSTELLRHVGDGPYRDILEAHHRIMRAAFEPEGGHEVNTQGDAFFVAFSQAAGAVSAAVAAQQAVIAHAWPNGVPVRVRMGIHTGEPTLGPGGYVGIDVHRAARICSAGHGGQILVSEQTREMARNALPGGVTLKDMGEHRLKDLARPEHLFQAVIQGLPEQFPPLKSLDVLTTNLPSLQLTSFIGREREMAEVKHLLSESHLVTLTGFGGSGKTRLSLQVAADLLEQFSQGVWLVELAPLADPALVSQTVAAVLGVREVPGRPIMETLVDYLRSRDLLLVLDNCEHLIEACAHLTGTLLRRCQKVRMLTSSREPLAVRGEVTFHVPPLTSPDPGHVRSVDALLQFEAARLFVERAVVSNPRFVVTDASAQAVAQIVHQLDGIPLAIELAAARVKVLPAEQIAKRLGDRFRLLTGGSRAGLPHHQTLRAVVDWSYELLSGDERLLFRRLAVFAGGFTLEAAETACAGGAIDETGVLDLLARLIDKSLVLTESLQHDIRYRMLETIRLYSHERLAESGEVEQIRGRHLDWYLAWAEQAEPALQGPEQLLWLERLEAEHDNLRGALEWARAGEGRREAGLRLAGALHRFWLLRGYLGEGRDWLDAFFGAGPFGPDRARAKAAYAAGVLALHQGDYGQADARSAESQDLYREMDDAPGMARALNVLGTVLRNRGEYGTARGLLDESLALSRRSGHTWSLAETLNILGVTVRRQGEHALATAMFEESLALWRQIGDRWGLAASLGHLGVVARQQGDYERARTLHEESLALRRELGDRRNIAAALSSLGVVALHMGDYEHAADLLEESLTFSRDLGDKMSTAATLCTLGLAAHRAGDDDRAAPLLEESLELSKELGDRLNNAAALCNLGFVAFHRGDIAGSLRRHRESLALYQALDDTMGIAECLVGLARALASDDAGQAARFLGAANAMRQARGVAIPPADRADYEQTVAAVRNALGAEPFKTAWAQGQATGPQEIIAQAIR